MHILKKHLKIINDNLSHLLHLTSYFLIINIILNESNFQL